MPGPALDRRDFLVKSLKGATVLFCALSLPPGVPATASEYNLLLNYIRTDDLESPLFAFNDFFEAFDEEGHRATLDYFQKNPEVLQGALKKFGDAPVTWKLASFRYRIVFVPEKREGFARLHRRYCAEAIDFVLQELGLDNPLNAIVVLRQENPPLPDSGVTAFLVHNLAKEFEAVYAFYAGDRPEVEVALNGKVFTSVVGAYGTSVTIGENGRLQFENDRHTIWQNSAENPYTALSVPVEETLHIAMRKHTARQVRLQLRQDRVKTLGRLKKELAEAMAVEEALVGGVVHNLLPVFLNRYVAPLPGKLPAGDLAQKEKRPQYRYLRKGVELVRQMGCRKAVERYADDPAVLRQLLL
jgi:hypothetical protein